MAKRMFKVGDKVMARWPGSSLYYEGEVEDYNDIEYLVKFEDPDESKLAIKYRDVTARKSFRSGRSRSRGRSPARGRKSPARSSGKKATSKSPSRTATSKSPSRTATKASPTKRAAVKADADTSKTSSKGSKSPSRSSTRSSVDVSSVLSNSTSLKQEAQKLLAPVRQSARLAAMDKPNSVETTSFTGNSLHKKDGASAGCMVLGCLTKACNIVCPAVKTLPAIAFLTLVPILFTQACTKKKCTVLEMPDFPRKFESYYDQQAVLLTLGGLAVHYILCYVPLKSKVLPNGAKSRGSGILALVLSLAALGAAVYFKQNVQLMYTLLRPLLVAHTAAAFLISILLFIKSYYAPRSQINSRITGHFLPDFVEGREIAPRLGSIDLKTFFMRYGFTYLVVFNAVLIIRDVQMAKNGIYNQNLIAACVMQMVLGIDWLWFQDSFYSTFEYSKFGCGLMHMCFTFTLTFYSAIYTRLLINYKMNLPWYCLAGCVVLMIAGYIINRCSNNQKHAFRTNPSSPQLAHLESVPTSTGSRLLVSGWWGLVRHPNYLGDLISQLGMVLLTGFGHGISWLMFGISFLSIIWRIYDSEKMSKAKYGMSWGNYASRIKYRLIPKVF